MKDTTRRGFLAAAGAGTAVAGAAALSPSIAGAAVAAAPAAAPAAATGSTPTVVGSLVAHVADVRSGNVSVMVGEREVVVHAPELVATLVRAAQ